MTKYLILHGTNASPDDNWFMWLKGKLIGKGHQVWLPHLPNSKEPNSETYANFLLSNKDFVIDSETVIIGHSSGAVETLRLLEKIDVTIKAAILVSAFKDDLGWGALAGLFQSPFDFETIKLHCDKFIFVHSDNDPYVPLEHAEYLSERLNAELTIVEGQGHFNTESSPDYKQFPQLIEILRSIE